MDSLKCEYIFAMPHARTKDRRCQSIMFCCCCCCSFCKLSSISDIVCCVLFFRFFVSLVQQTHDGLDFCFWSRRWWSVANGWCWLLSSSRCCLLWFLFWSGCQVEFGFWFFVLDNFGSDCVSIYVIWFWYRENLNAK